MSGLDKLNEKSVTPDNLSALDRAWPTEEYDGLIEAYEADPGAEWDKAEAYFIELRQKPKFHLRIKVWLFYLNFDKQANDLLYQQNTVFTAFKKIIESDKLRKLLGAILKFGNCLNAGKKDKGQADGFTMNDLSKTQTLKDANGNNILKIICKILFEEDNEFAKFKSDFSEVYDAVKITTEDLKKKTENLKKDYGIAQNNFS